MFWCDSFAIQPANVTSNTCSKLGLSLWPVTEAPLRASIRSLPAQKVSDVDDLKLISVLAVFSYLPEGQDGDREEDFEFPIEVFRSAFGRSGFDEPVNLPGDGGFCFVLMGKEANCLCRARCISLMNVIKTRSFFGQKVLKSQPLFDLFPCLTRMSLRFPVCPPPLTATSFLPLKRPFVACKANDKRPELLWEKSDKIERWKKHLSPITEAIFVGSETIAKDQALLKKNGITHILNCASQVVSSAPGFVQMNLALSDGGNENILSHVFGTTVFINNAIKENGKILVHCVEGVSRSVAVVIGYLILMKKMSYQEALKVVRSRRRVASPNPKFMAQLIQLSEVVGSSSASTCAFSRKKCIPFEVCCKNDMIVPVPIYGDMPQKDRKCCFVVVKYDNVDSISRCDKGEAGTVAQIVGASCSREFRKVADKLVSDLCECLRVRDADKIVPQVHMYRSPDWREVPLSTIDNLDQACIYIVITRNGSRVIVGKDAPSGVDLTKQMQRCCQKHKLECPPDFEIIDLGEQEEEEGDYSGSA